jgi:hypothetical protein
MSEYVGELVAMAETQAWRARDAAWWSELTYKRRGEMAEAAFLHKASTLGFGVSKFPGRFEITAPLCIIRSLRKWRNWQTHQT